MFFEVDEGDFETIEKVSKIMQDVVNELLYETNYKIKVGEPDIIKHGELWLVDKGKYIKQFNDLLNYNTIGERS